MTQPSLIRFLIAVLVISALGALTVTAQDRSADWLSWDATLTDFDLINNQFRVIETQTVIFSGTFERGTRRLALTNLEDIRVIGVRYDNLPLAQNCAEQALGAYCVRTEDTERVIRYSFPAPLTNNSATITFEYEVIGALRIFEGGDQLQWQAIPAGRAGNIDSSTLIVELPPQLAPRAGIDPVQTSGAPATVNVQGSVITARATRVIIADESFSIRAQFPHTPNARVPAWQSTVAAEAVTQTAVNPTEALINLAGLAFGVLIGVGGVLLAVIQALRARVTTSVVVPEYLSEPPSDVPPALAGVLVENRLRPTPHHILATILHLAGRGYLRLEEQSDALGGTTLAFQRISTSAPRDQLRGFEQRLLDALFSDGSTRTLESLQNTFYSNLSHLYNGITAELMAMGLFSQEMQRRRAAWRGYGALLFIVALVVLFLSNALPAAFQGVATLIGMALGANGLVRFVLAGSFSPIARAGKVEALKWGAFKQYLANIQRYAKQAGVARGDFDRYLPYAMAFGLADAWIAQFSSVRDVPIPDWYVPYYIPYTGGYSQSSEGYATDERMPTDTGSRDVNVGDALNDMNRNLGGSLNSISLSLSSMLNSAAAALVSTPASSGGGDWSSSGSWDTGGSSWSGDSGGDSGGGDSSFD